MQSRPGVFESVSTARQIDAPDTKTCFTDQVLDLIGSGFEVPRPMPESGDVMVAQILNVHHFETAGAHFLEREADVRQFAMREDVAINETAAAPAHRA